MWYNQSHHLIKYNDTYKMIESSFLFMIWSWHAFRIGATFVAQRRTKKNTWIIQVEGRFTIIALLPRTPVEFNSHATPRPLPAPIRIQTVRRMKFVTVRHLVPKYSTRSCTKIAIKSFSYFRKQLTSQYKPIVCALKNYNLNSREKF